MVETNLTNINYQTLQPSMMTAKIIKVFEIPIPFL